MKSLKESILDGSDQIVGNATSLMEKRIKLMDSICRFLVRNAGNTIQFDKGVYIGGGEHSYTFTSNKEPSTEQMYRSFIKFLKSKSKNLIEPLGLYVVYRDVSVQITDHPDDGEDPNKFGYPYEIYFRVYRANLTSTMYLRVNDKWPELVKKIQNIRWKK